MSHSIAIGCPQATETLEYNKQFTTCCFQWEWEYSDCLHLPPFIKAHKIGVHMQWM